MDSFSKVLSDMADNTEPNETDGDYIKDGLLFCGKCHTPKQIEVVICGKAVKPYCLCKCGEEEEKAKQEKIREIFRKEEIERNRHSGFLDIDMIGRAAMI